MSEDWTLVLSRILPTQVSNLDDLIDGGEVSVPRGGLLAPVSEAAPSAELWHRALDGPSHIGIRVTRSLAAPDRAAARLAGMAIERSVVPVILIRVDFCGLERFGLRIERLPDDPEAAGAAEEELRKFWDLAIIIDGEEIGLLG
ncbi:hypothetical protein [Tropicimonas aquimaris]|uniref:CheW-like domain-containing protein n=1 Tax=Tropicimonas aquimaris TaxID=914152 RepID=A0ABW3IV39_9RHOB